MFSFLSDSLSAKAFGSIASLAVVLCLGSLGGCADTAPVAQAAPNLYYLNGKPSTKEAVEKLDPQTIASMNVLSGKQAVEYTHDAKQTGAVLVQTK